jgi:hypothetical protein
MVFDFEFFRDLNNQPIQNNSASQIKKLIIRQFRTFLKMDFESGEEIGSRLNFHTYSSAYESLSPDSSIRFTDSMLEFPDDGGELENVLEGLHLSSTAPKRKLDGKSKKITLCQGSFFTDCKTNLAGNNRLCGTCLRFEIPIGRAFLCFTNGNSPFGYRKRTLTLRTGEVLEYRYFGLTDSLSREFSCRFNEDCEEKVKESEKLEVSCGIVFFRNENDATSAKESFPEFLYSLEKALLKSSDREFQLIAESKIIEFQRCSFCVRKVFPSSLFHSCSRPSCIKRASRTNETIFKIPEIPKIKSEKIERRKDENVKEEEILINDSSASEQTLKKPKVWEISPKSWNFISDAKPSKVVIKSPEVLSWNSVCVDIGGEKLLRDVDYIWGLTEIIILRLPNPDPKLVLLSQPKIDAKITIRDDQNVEGELIFEYVPV